MIDYSLMSSNVLIRDFANCQISQYFNSRNG